MTTEPTDKQKEEAREMADIQHLTKRLQCTCVGERADHHAQCPVRIGVEIATVVKSLFPARNTPTRDAAWMLVYDFEMIDCRCDGITLTAGAKANLERRVVFALASRDTEIREVLEGLTNYGGACWCLPDTETEPHSPACLAARALWERVQS